MKKIVVFTLALFSFISNSSATDLALSPFIAAPMNGCELSSSTVIGITVLNTEGIPHGWPYDLAYSVNGGPWIIETVLTSLGPNAVYYYSFMLPADLSDCQIHTIQCSITTTGDPDLSDNVQTYSVTSDCAPTPGNIVAPAEVCQSLNSGNLSLVGYTGNIQNWTYSDDGGASWNSLSNTTDIQSYSNISAQMEWHTLVGSPYGICPPASTDTITIDIVPQTIAGTLPADFDICENGNSGEINLTGYLGAILGWEFSQDGGITWTPIANTTDSQLYLNLTDTTLYHVEVQNGICPSDFTWPVTLTIIEGSNAGTIAGEMLVCNFENDSSLVITPVNGNVVGWDISVDNGLTWTSTGVTTSTYSYNGLTGYTVFAALVQAGSCPIDTAYHSIVVLPLAPTAGANITITEGDSTQLNADGGTVFEWFPAVNIDNASIANPTVWPITTTQYFVSVTDINGCTDTASVIVTVVPDLYTVIIPNCLTPNGDGYNDYLVIPNIENYPLNEIVIFNSYGQIIFQASPYSNDWTFTFKDERIPAGTFYYVLDLHDTAVLTEPIQGVITVMGQ